jgi:hypothetical protein
MDTAVGLVETYLRVNGYFTVTEYPIIQADRNGGYRTVTDLDILAVRFPGAGRAIPKEGASAKSNWTVWPPDPLLGVDAERTDLIIGEVKEGRAELNRAARDPVVLQIALTRFGCCSPKHAPELVEQILRKGHVLADAKHRIRLVAFGSTALSEDVSKHAAISLGHVTNFLRDYIRLHWDILRNADFKDPTFGFLVVLEKATKGLELEVPPQIEGQDVSKP